MAETTGMQVRRTQGMSPITMPRTAPGSAPRAKPAPIRPRLISRLAQSSPLSTVVHPAARMAVGAGKNRTSITCRRASPSHAARMNRGERSETPLGGRAGMAFPIDAEKVPDAGDVPAVLRVPAEVDHAPGAGKRHVDRGEDPAGGRGQHGDAVAEREGLIDAVGHEQDGLARFLEQPQELVL